jgi:hypothetical protein
VGAGTPELRKSTLRTTTAWYRSQHYLLDEFDRLYGGKAHTLPSWSKWESGVRKFSPLAQQAFDGKVNLHDHAELIDGLAATYHSLQQEAAGAWKDR